MQAAQPTAKLFTATCDLDSGALIEVFHTWIREHRFDDELLLIDVADYSHVHHGPGVLLVAHECYFSTDAANGRTGMLYRRRRGEPESVKTGLRSATDLAVRACKMLEADGEGRIRFDTSEVELGFDDRLRIPDTPESFADLEPELRVIGTALYPDGCELSHAGSTKGCFRATVRCGGAPPALDELLNRLARV